MCVCKCVMYVCMSVCESMYVCMYTCRLGGVYILSVWSLYIIFGTSYEIA